MVEVPMQCNTKLTQVWLVLEVLMRPKGKIEVL